MKIYILITVIFLLSCTKKSQEIGSDERPFIMALIPSENATNSLYITETIEKSLSKSLSEILLHKKSGFHVKVIVPNSYVVTLESFASKRVDFASISTLSYILAKDVKKLHVDPILIGIGDRISGANYFSQIIVRSDSGIKSIKDLNGKKFAFTDPASTSGHLVPRSFLRKNGIILKEKVFAGRHDNVVIMVMQGKVDAGATYHIRADSNGKPRDARIKVITQYPNVFEDIKILTLSSPIPNSPWVLRSNIYKDQAKYKTLKKAVQQAMYTFIHSKMGRKIATEMMNIQDFQNTDSVDYKERLKVFDREDLEFLY